MEESEWNPPSRDASPRASAIFRARFRRVKRGFAEAEEFFIGIRDLQSARRANGRGMIDTGCGADPSDGYSDVFLPDLFIPFCQRLVVVSLETTRQMLRLL